MSLDLVFTCLLCSIGLYGVIAGAVGAVSSSMAENIGAELPARVSYVAMATLGLFGFLPAGALVALSLGAPPFTAELLGSLILCVLWTLLAWATGLGPVILYGLVAKARIRLRRRRRGIARLIWGRRKETNDDKIQQTITAAGIMAVACGVGTAVLAGKFVTIDWESAGSVFGIVCFIVVLTAIFAASGLQRFSAWE